MSLRYWYFTPSMDYDATISQEGVIGAAKSLGRTWGVFFRNIFSPFQMAKEFGKLDVAQRRKIERLKQQIAEFTEKVNDLRESDYEAAERQGIDIRSKPPEPITDEQLVEAVLKGRMIPFYTTACGHRIESLQKQLDKKLLEYVKLSEIGNESMDTDLNTDNIDGVGLADEVTALDQDGEQALERAQDDLEAVAADAQALEAPVEEAVAEGADEEEAAASVESFYSKRLLIAQRVNRVRETIGLESLPVDVKRSSRDAVGQTLHIVTTGLKVSRESILPGHEVETNRGVGVVTGVYTRPFTVGGKSVAASAKNPRYRVSYESDQRDVIFSGEKLTKTGSVRQVGGKNLVLSQEGVYGFLLGGAKAVGAGVAGAVVGSVAGPVGSAVGFQTGAALVDQSMLKERIRLKKQIEQIADRIVQARDGDFKAAIAKGSKPSKAELDENDREHVLKWTLLGRLIPFYSGYNGHKIEQLQDELKEKIAELESIFNAKSSKR